MSLSDFHFAEPRWLWLALAAPVLLAWLHAQRTVTAPIASARSAAQLAELLPMARLRLSAEELRRLAEA